MDAFADGLRSWHDFFMLVGAAAATLMGLVFVGVSLGGNTGRGSMRTLHTFVSPIVLHFSYVLLLAAAFVVPTHRPWTLAALSGGLALALLTVMVGVLRGLVAHHRDGAVDLDHWVWHFALPLVTSLATLGASAALIHAEPWAIELLAASAALLLVVGVRNSWKLVTWILEHRAPQARDDDA
jgi:hypothetical protein